MQDKRIAYGACCSWWDSIDKVGKRGNLPCCPHCRNVLFEVDSIETWNQGAKKYEEAGHPGYVKMLNWARGKCFPSYQIAKETYEKEHGEAK